MTHHYDSSRTEEQRTTISTSSRVNQEQSGALSLNTGGVIVMSHSDELAKYTVVGKGGETEMSRTVLRPTAPTCGGNRANRRCMSLGRNERIDSR